MELKGRITKRERNGTTMISKIIDILSDSAWLGAISALVGSVITYLVTTNNNRKDLTISDKDDRVQLSRDQIELISQLRDMVNEQRDEVNSMRIEMKELQRVNFELTVQNRDLQIKISKLSKKLDSTMNRNTKGGN